MKVNKLPQPLGLAVRVLSEQKFVQDHLKNPALLVKLATDSSTRDAINQEVFKLPLLCIEKAKFAITLV